MTLYNNLLSILFLPLLGLWSDGDFTKNVHKEYDVPKDATVELINKYGYTKIHAWDKRIVTIDVNIIANTSSKDRAEEIFDKIDINFTTTNNYIKAETVINTNSKSWWDWKNWINGWNSNSSYKINYDVYMPTDLFLKLNQKYGDAFVDQLDRNAIIKISYGNVRMDGVNGDLDIDIAYGGGNLGNFKNGNVNLRYSKLSMSNMGNGSVDSKYSNLKMQGAERIKMESAYGELRAEHIVDLDLHSRYDDIFLETVDKVYINSGYSDFDLNKISKSGVFSSTYGDIIIRDLGSNFESMDLKTSYTDIRLSTHGVAYRLDASGNYADIKTTSNFTDTYRVEKSNSKTIKGHNKSDNTGGIIRANLSYGGLRIED